MITLYDYWRSSASYRVRMALNLLGLDWQSVPIDLVKGEQRSAAHLARNPQGLVPAILVEGRLLTQSLAIIEYLDEGRGQLLPRDPIARARVRALSHAIAMEVAPICNLSVRNHVATLTEGRTSADDWQRHYIGQGLAAFERMLDDPATGLFCHGDSVTMADLCLIPQLYNADRIGLDVTSHGRIHAIRDRLLAIPAIQAAHPDKVKPQ